MKVCPNKNCGATNIAPNARYCPHCGKRFPHAKDVRVMEIDKWNSLKAKNQPSSSKKQIDRDEYNRIVESYNNMVRNGYASSDKELITDSELQQLRKNTTELDDWKRECKRRNTPIYDYEDEYTHDFYWGNALLGIAILGAVIFWIFFAIPTIWGWIFGSDDQDAKTGVEIVLNEKTGKYGIMNHEMDSLVTPCIYDTIVFENNKYDLGRIFYRLERNAKTDIADSTGLRTISNQLDSIENCGYQLYRTYKDGKQGLMSNKGRPILETNFYRVLWNYKPRPWKDKESPGSFIGNIIPVMTSKDSGWTLFTRHGKKINYEEYKYVSQVGHADLIKVATSYYKWGLIDSNGKTILPCSYYYIYIFNENKAWIRKSYSKDDSWICISPKGEKLGTLSSSYYPDIFSCGLSVVSDGKGHHGYCDSCGNIVIPLKYGYYEYYQESKRYVRERTLQGDSAYVSLDGKNGILRKNGSFEPRE